MFLVLLTAFWGTKWDESLKYLREITTKFILFTVYKQPFHKMPVWTLILLWPVHIQKCLYQTKCGSSHTMKCLAPRLHLAAIKGLFVKWMSSVSAVCSQPSESVKSKLTLLICQSVTYWARMTVVVPSLTENTRQLFSLTKLEQRLTNEWIISWVYCVSQ